MKIIYLPLYLIHTISVLSSNFHPDDQREEKNSYYLVVDTQHNTASDANEGSHDSPFKTIQGALDKFSSSHGKIIVKKGVYRESVDIYQGGLSNNQRIEIIGYDAIIKGSDPFHGTWTREVKTGLWKSSLEVDKISNEKPFLKVNNSTEKTLEKARSKGFLDKLLMPTVMLFQNGQSLEQVTKKEDLLKKNSGFFIDRDFLILYIKTHDNIPPTQLLLEITTRSYAFKTKCKEIKYVSISGFSITNIGDKWPLPPGGAISVNRGVNWKIFNNKIKNVNGTAISLPGCDSINVYNNIISNIGISGIAAPYAPENLIIENNCINNVCTHDVQLLHESAGIKLHQASFSLIKNNIISDVKFGCGIWLDYNNQNNRITANTIKRVNTILGGIFIEASPKPNSNLIDNNTLANISQNGILTRVSDSVIIAFNVLINSNTAINLNKGNPHRSVKGRLSTNSGHVVLGNLILSNDNETNTKIPTGTVLEANSIKSDHNNIWTYQESKNLRFRVRQDSIEIKNMKKYFIDDLTYDIRIHHKCINEGQSNFYPGPYYISDTKINFLVNSCHDYELLPGNFSR